MPDDGSQRIVNELLEYVPTDSSMVLTSTRGIDLDHPLIKSYFTKFEQLLEDLIKEDASNAVYEVLIEWTRKHELLATEWGIHPQGREDSIVYMTDDKLVLQSTLTDGNKTKAKLFELLQAIKGITVSEIEIDGKAWHLIGLEDDETVKLAASIGSKSLTVSLVFDAGQDLSYLNDLLKPAAKPIRKAVFGQVSEQSVVIGYIDSVKLLKQALNPSTDLGKLLQLSGQYEASELCANELETLAKAFPRLAFNTAIHADKIVTDYVLELKDTNTIAVLKSIQGRRIGIESAQSLISLFISLDLGKSIGVLSQWSENVSKTPYRCEALKFINDAGDSLAKLKEFSSDKKFDFIHTLNGFGISIESIDYCDDGEEISASSYILGQELQQAVKLGKQLFGPQVPALQSLKTEKGLVSAIDLSDLPGMPITTVQTVFTDSGLIIATDESIDIVKLSKLEVVDTQNILDLSLNYKALTIKNHNVNFASKFEIAVVDEGLRFSIISRP